MHHHFKFLVLKLLSGLKIGPLVFVAVACGSLDRNKLRVKCRTPQSLRNDFAAAYATEFHARSITS
jgi:hypothetical protein